MAVKIFADGIRPDAEYINYLIDVIGVSGFTCNPTLVKKLVGDKHLEAYEKYAKFIIEHSRGFPVSIQVLSDDPKEMIMQGIKIASWGKNVYVKVPIENANGASNYSILNELAKKNIKLNITAIFNALQIRKLGSLNFIPEIETIFSIFAGRLSDIGSDPAKSVLECAIEVGRMKHSLLLWAGVRQIYDIARARHKCDIITLPESVLDKMHLKDKNWNQYSMETVQMFTEDGKKFKI